MFWCSKLKILFCIKLFFGLFNGIVSNEDIYDKMSLEDRRSFFGTEDGSVPEFQLVELIRPTRSKRSTEDPIDITFNAFGTFSTASLKLVKDHDLINRRFTGIWYAETNADSYRNVLYTPIPQEFDSLGHFEFWQNPNDGSAVTLFRDSRGNENIIGILKLNYTVKTVPKRFSYAFVDVTREHVLKKRSANPTRDEDKESHLLAIFMNNGIPQENFRLRNVGQNADHIDLHRSRRQNVNVPNVVYSKLLLVPDFGLVTRYTTVKDFLKQCIAQVNTVDMMYRQLKDPEVHLSITGIIIPRDATAMPYLSVHTFPDGYMDADQAVDAAEINFQNEPRRFPDNNWDAIVILTTHLMYAFDSRVGHNVTIRGLGQYTRGCSGGVALAKFAEGIEGVHFMAHELAHLFNVFHDGESTSAHCNTDGGYTMVPRIGLTQKLEWSPCSRDSFKSFFRSSLGDCTYYQPYMVPDETKSMRGAWLSLAGQCDNEFNDSSDHCHRNDDDGTCEVMGCKRHGICAWLTKRPLDGSEYDINGPSQACIDGVWNPVWNDQH